MITIESASIYSVNSEMAYSITYSDGTKVRAVVGCEIIRMEVLKGCEWKQSGKPYIIVKSKKRQAERIVEQVKAFLK